MAAFETFSTFTDYGNAVGNTPFATQNFEGVPSGTDLNGVTFLPGVSATSNLPGVVAFTGTGDTDLFILNRASVLQDSFYELSFSQPYNAVGFDIEAFNPATPGPATLEIFFADGDRTSIDLFPTNPTESDPLFFGVLADTNISRIRLTEGPEINGVGNEEIALDNFAIADTSVRSPGRLFATELGTNNIVELDTKVGTVLDRFSYGSLEPPISGSEGLAFDGDRLFFTSGAPSSNKNLWQLEVGTGNFLDVDAVNAERAGNGLANLGDSVHLLDFRNAEIIEFDPGDSPDPSTPGVELGTLPLDAIPFAENGGLTALGANAFLTTDGVDTLYEINATDGTISNSFTLDNAGLDAGLAVIGGEIFVGAVDTPGIKVFDLSGNFKRNLAVPFEVSALAGGPGTPPPSPVLFGTSDDDTFRLSDPPRTVFARAGDDIVDASGSSGFNTVYGARGDDTITASHRDRVFAGSGDDVLDASSGSGRNQLRGGVGNDELIAGKGDRLFGGRGNDTIYLNRGVAEGRRNSASGNAGNDIFYLSSDDVVFGGRGRDQFWIISDGELPTQPNIIKDFTSGQDVLGIEGLNITSANLAFTQIRRNTVVSLDGLDLVILSGINAASLSPNDFVFQSGSGQPDLEVSSFEITNDPFTAGNRIAVPVEVVVTNSGDGPADIFKLDVKYFDPGLNGTFVTAFSAQDTAQVDPDSGFYPFTRNPLKAGASLTIPGTVFLPEDLDRQNTTLTVTADSISGDEFIDEFGRVEESNEENNQFSLETQVIVSNDSIINVADLPGFELLDDPLQIDEGIWFLGTGPSPDEARILSPNNAAAADTINADELRSGEPLGLDLDGSGVTVGVWEARGGYVRGTHEALLGRVTFGDTGGSTTNHATEVAGTIASSSRGRGGGLPPSGPAPDATGIAPQANIVSYDSQNDLLELDRDASLIDIANHSYGARTGWSERFNWGPAVGTVDTWFEARDQFTEDTLFGKYNAAASNLDQVLFNNPQLLSVWAAGNDRNDNFTNQRGDNTYVTAFSTPLPGTPLTGGPRAVPYYLVSTAQFSAPPQDGNGGTGFDSLPPDQVAKNSLVVGSTNDVTDDPIDPDGVNVSNFSSWGPTDDGRIKPDVVANGESLFTSSARSDSSYRSPTGSSFAAPSVTGAVALLLEHYRNLRAENPSSGKNNFFSDTPRSATTKGLLIHTAQDIGNVGPDYSSGWGLVDAAAAADFLTNVFTEGASTDLVYENVYNPRDGEDFTLDVVSDGTGPLKVTLAWTDPAGTPHGPGLDITTPVLVNDLDLWVTGPDGTSLPWTLDPSNPAAPAVRTAQNSLDNVEQVLIDAPSAGTYTIHVGRTGSSFVQAYSLLASGGSLGPDLVVESFEVNGEIARIDENRVEVPVALQVANQGALPADIFKVSVDFQVPGEPSFVAAFTAEDTDEVNPVNSFYPFTRNPLAAGSTVTFTGSVIFREPDFAPSQVTLRALADSIAGDEFILESGRVLESDETNNLSDPLELLLPSL